MRRLKIAVAGIGYVGLANAVLLARRHDVIALDIDAERVQLLESRRSPTADNDIEAALKGGLTLEATLDADFAFRGADFIIIATPTDYDPKRNYFDTSSVEDVLRKARAVNKAAAVVISARRAGASRLSVSDAHSRRRRVGQRRAIRKYSTGVRR